MSELKFICPLCRETTIEEIVVSATVSYVVNVTEDGEYAEVSRPFIQDGETQSFNCQHCGYQIGEDGEITSIETLAEWLLEKDYNKEQKDGKR